MLRSLIFPILLALLLAGQSAIGQKPFFNHYTTLDGLPSIECYDLIQDSTGFIWIGTDRGLARFDGSSFRTFSTKDGLPGNAITTLYPADDGHIWAYCHARGFAYSDGFSIEAPDWNADFLYSRSRLEDFMDQGNGDFFIGMRSYPARPALWMKIRNDRVQEEPQTLDQNCIIWLESDGRRAATATRPPGLATDSSRFQLRGSAIEGFDIPLPERFRNLGKVRVHDDRLYCIFNNVIFCFGFDGNLLAEYEVNSRTNNCLYFDNNGDLWAGTIEHGVLHFKDGDLLKTPERYLPNRSVTSVLQDNDGGFWFTTIEAGVYHMPYRQLRIIDKSSGLTSERATFQLSDDSCMYAFFRDGTILRSRLSHPEKEPSLVADYRYVFSAFMDRDNTLNVSVDSKSDIEPTGIREWTAFSQMQPLGSDSLIICAIAGAIWLFEGEDSIQLSKTNEIPRVKAVAKNKDYLYLGTAGGLYRIKKGYKQVENISHLHPDLDGPINEVLFIKKYLIVSLNGQGIAVIDENESISTFTTEDGLSSDYINRFVADKQDGFWLCTTEGIDHIQVSDLTQRPLRPMHIGVEQGLPLPSVNDLKISGDNLWALTDGGIAIIPFAAIEEQSAPPVYLESFKVNGLDYAIGDDMVFSSYENNLKIEYQSIAYKNPRGINFSYRLENASDPNQATWVSTASRSLDFPRLAPGKYDLTIVSGELERNSESSVSLQFEILEPLWQRWYMILLAAMVLITGGSALAYQRINTVEKEAALRQQISSLGYRALRAQMNPHFIYNALNAIQNFIIQKDQKASISYLNDFSKLIRKIFDHSSHDHVPIKDELEAVELYVSLELARYPNRFEFATETEGLPQHIRIPPMILQPFIENAILHGVLPNDQMGRIVLRISVIKEYIHVEIEDNGIGINRGREIGERKKSYLGHTKGHGQQSGMSVTHQRIEQLAERQKIDAMYSVSDLSDESPQKTGTIVTFNLPFTSHT